MLPSAPCRERLGAVHGRFQPFHNGHLRYVTAALQLAESLYVGITNPNAPETTVAEETDALRHLPANNPFTFEQRRRMVYESVAIAHPGAERRLNVVPFDVNGDSKNWPEVIPIHAVQFVVPLERWDLEKARRFERVGYRVVLLAMERGRITATEVRRRIALGDESWRELVPRGTAAYLSNPALLACIIDVSPSSASKKANNGNLS